LILPFSVKGSFISISLFLSLCALVEALELKIPNKLIESEVKEQFFVGGRSYLSGDKTSTCDYAYLENPSVSSQNGRIAIEATFNGKAGREVLGKCIGIGRTFGVIISGLPAYREGELRFEDSRIQFKNAAADAVFGKLLEGYAEDLERELAFPIKDEVQDIAETLTQSAGYDLKLEQFSVSRIDVDPDAVRLQLAGTIVVGEKQR
jgi:hypothetical protein